MSTEDVIELGSSDDEKEPAPKKKKTVPNAMVRIPNPYARLPGLTIKPANKNSTRNHKPILDKIKINHSNILPQVANISNRINAKITPNKQGVIQKRQGVRCIPIKICKSVRPFNATTNMTNKANARPKIKGITPGTTLLNNLPPSITIKRTNESAIRKISHLGKQPCKKMKLIKPDSQVIQTVEIDDEDMPATSASMPQWYKRPEEENEREESLINPDTINEKVESIEEQNNKEPEPSNYIEITIEDSPIKHIQSKHTVEVNNATITIEDSPIKAYINKEVNSEIIDSQQDKHSKKKLDYPHEIQIVNNGMLEIEIQPIEKNNLNKEKLVVKAITHTEQSNKPNQSKDNNEADTVISTSKINDSCQNGEFNVVYQKFIDTCFRIENSDDMKKIVEKKIKAYYRQCSKEFVDSEEFIDLVSGKILAIEASPDKMYLYIKDVVDELNMQRKLTKATGVKKDDDDDFADYKEDTINRSEYDTKRQRQIRKLEKTLKKLHRAIQKLEEQEVDFDDEDDSVYLLTERYKERLVKVHAKFCQLTNTKMPSEPNIKLEPRPGRPAGPVRKVEKLINVKVPIGAPLPFPDFQDVLCCVREANVEDKLGWTEMEIIDEARDIFTSCGKKLQRRRQENEWRIAVSRLPTNEDPAEKDESLKNILEKNKQIATKKESEIFNKYTDRQIQLKLEAVEIGDKEAEESPVESEEDDDIESSLLKDKEKRKIRLKRLIQEKSKTVIERADDSKNLENSKEGEKERSDQVADDENASNSQEEKDNEIMDMDAEHKENDKNELKAISDDGIIESDVDELHLLQKLYSENEANSSTVDSESESPICLSDSDNENSIDNIKASTLNTMDVISIENSSYSESENNIDDTNDRNIAVTNENNVEDLSNMKVKIVIDDCNKTGDQCNTDTNCNSVNDSVKRQTKDDTENYADCYETNPSSIESIYSNESSKGISESFSSISEKEYCKETNSKIQSCMVTDSNVIKKNSKYTNNQNVLSDTQNEEILLSVESNIINVNDEESNENVLLSLSDDECHHDDAVNENLADASVNLGDDNISISETYIGIVASNEKNDEDKEAGPIENHKNENDSPCGIEIGKDESNITNDTNIAKDVDNKNI